MDYQKGADQYLYVGRTGDSSSPNACSPFSRMSAHLGTNKNSNTLTKHLDKRGLDRLVCSFRLISVGPILKEVSDMDAHRPSRDAVAAMEKQLQWDLIHSGYEVLNKVNCNAVLDKASYQKVAGSFAKYFPELERKA